MYENVKIDLHNTMDSLEYGVVANDGSLGVPLVLIQQQQTHALWRELKMKKGHLPIRLNQ